MIVWLLVIGYCFKFGYWNLKDMDFKPEMLHLLSCPLCQGELKYTKEKVLFCIKCRHSYPIEEGIPDLSPEAAIPLSPEGEFVPRQKAAHFTIKKGKDIGTHFRLQSGTCRAIGRRLEDSVQTQVFNVDFTMTLDDHTKKLISNYLSKTTGKQKKKLTKKEEGSLGSFKRLPDLILNDTAVSRLHAMIFYDESGQTGVLDLVSKNGTFVNGREVETCLLKPNDEIIIGDTKIVLSLK